MCWIFVTFQLSLVDLAGSERAAKTGASAEQLKVKLRTGHWGYLSNVFTMTPWLDTLFKLPAICAPITNGFPAQKQCLKLMATQLPLACKKCAVPIKFALRRVELYLIK